MGPELGGDCGPSSLGVARHPSWMPRGRDSSESHEQPSEVRVSCVPASFHPSLCGPGPPPKSPPSASMHALGATVVSLRALPLRSLGKLSLELIKRMVLSPAHCPVPPALG